jgi:tetratricopeptide (TPR) repeat protein
MDPAAIAAQTAKTLELLNLTPAQMANGHRRVVEDHLEDCRQFVRADRDPIPEAFTRVVEQLRRKYSAANVIEVEDLEPDVEAAPEAIPTSTTPTPAEPDLTPDKEQVNRYLQLLQKDRKTARLRAFAHKKHPRHDEIGARTGGVNLAEVKRWQQGERRVYCVVNNGGDSAAAVTSCTANYFEFDGLTVEQQRERLAAHPEIASLVGMAVATRERDDASLHCYLLLEQPETEVWWWRLQQWRLIRLFKSDPKIEDPSRVMVLPGTHYINGDGQSLGRAHIVEELTTEQRVTSEQLDAALSEVEQRLNLQLWEAIPSSRRTDKEVLAMLQARHPAAVPAEKPESKLWDNLREAFPQKPWHRARTLDEIKEALAMMPPRKSGLETYGEDRKVLCGLATALEEVGLERGHAITMLEDAGWTGWNANQVLGSSMEMASDTFWAHARKCGWSPKAEKAVDEFRSALIDLHKENLTADELTAALMALAMNHRQQYISVRRAYDELLENERGIERLREALDLITAATEEEPITAQELVSEQFCTEVIEDFQKRFVADDLMVLMLVLTTMSSVLPIGTKVRLLDYTLHDQAALIYLMILTTSGGKKTMLFEQLVEGPLMASGVKERADKTFLKVQRLQAMEKAKKEAKKRKKGEDAEPQPDPDAGIAPEEGTTTPETSSTAVLIRPLLHVVADFTGEGIDRNCQQAARHYGHGFLIGTDEGRQLMSGDQYKGSGSTYTIDKLTRLYDGKGANQVRGNSNNERHYDKSHVAIAVLVQPEIYDELSAKSADDESGFWPRFLTLECGPIQTRRLGKEERQALTTATYPAALQRIYDYANQLGDLLGREQLGEAPAFRFSDEAQDWWIERNYEIEDRQLHEAQNGDPVVSRLLGKAAGQVGRLAVLLHILEHAIIGDLADLPDREIPLVTVEKAYRLQARLMARTLKQRLRVHNGCVTDDAALLREVQKRCMEKDPQREGLKLGVIERFWNQRNRPSKEELYQAVTALAAAGYGLLTSGRSNRAGFIYTATEALPA